MHQKAIKRVCLNTYKDQEYTCVFCMLSYIIYYFQPEGCIYIHSHSGVCLNGLTECFVNSSLRIQLTKFKILYLLNTSVNRIPSWKQALVTAHYIKHNLCQLLLQWLVILLSEDRSFQRKRKGLILGKLEKKSHLCLRTT